MTTHYLRNPDVVVFADGEFIHLVGLEVRSAKIGPIEATPILDLLELASVPVAAAKLEELATPTTLELLLSRGVLERGTEAELATRLPIWGSVEGAACETLVIGISGAVAAAHSVTRLFPLLRGFADTVHVIVTGAAEHFVEVEAFRHLGCSVWTDAFQSDADVNVPHIHVAEQADLVVVWPASAATLAKVAHGACDDLLSLVIAATEAPVVMFPSMNHAMWTDPAVARNVAQLRDDGVVLIEPGVGFEASATAEHELAVGVPGGASVSMDVILRTVLAAVS